MEKHDVAIIGSGPTALYLLKHIFDHASLFTSQIKSLTIFEKSTVAGMGMPYNPEMTDRYHMCNISSEEIPELVDSFAHWLNEQPIDTLKKFNITEFPIDKSKLYSRVSLGYYFNNQYEKLIAKLKEKDIEINELLEVNVLDLIPNTHTRKIQVNATNTEQLEFTKVIIATGHTWSEEDQPTHGYYGSPWPVFKFLPEKDHYFNFTIGTLGASLSAFDVVTSLAHRHGEFVKTSHGLKFHLNQNAQDFKIVMHSAEGWLPHLQYEQEKPIREIYRHTNRSKILSLIDDSGFLPLADFFDMICRPALIKAFEKDENQPLVNFLNQSSTGLKDFVECMVEKHEYVNSFVGMQKELKKARTHLKQNKPTHWIETLDDLMYCLNFHAELLSAEDHLFFRKSMMPFLMNVIAALPLSSAYILLALYEAGCIDLLEGKVEIEDNQSATNKTIIDVKNPDVDSNRFEYELFINCSGQGNIKFKDYPFPSLITSGTVRKARARFKNKPNEALLMGKKNGKIRLKQKEAYLYTGGIDVDAGYRVIRSDGSPDSRIHDVSFVHTAGCRPYSYGLQACNATSLILVEAWKNSGLMDSAVQMSIESITKTYENNQDL